MKLSIEELQALMNALDYCVEYGDRSIIRQQFPVLATNLDKFGSLRGKLVRERIAIDPEFGGRLV